jgi:hypothetical protein
MALLATMALVTALNATAIAHEIDQTERVIWPDLIPIAVGMEPEGIEMGNDTEFFVGANSWTGNLTHAGAIYRGDLVTGEGQIVVAPTGKTVSGLSYDARTDYLYAATGYAPGGFAGPFLEQGVKVYAGTSGRLLGEVIFGDGIVANDVLVTENAVYCTDSISTTLYKIPLEDNGRVFSSVPEKIEMTGFEMVDGFNANGLVSDFDGKELVIINITSGVLYLVDTETGAASPVSVQGEEQLFPDGDGLYMDGRTLYIMQNFSQKIAVVELSKDMTQGTFVKNLVSDDFSVPTTITGYGNCVYAINTGYLEFTAEGVDPNLVQTEVVKLFK